MPKRWAILLLPLPNSEVVAISEAMVFKITEVFWLDESWIFAFFLAFFALLKKYLTFFLSTISNNVPKITKAIIAITKICIAIGDTKLDNPANGLL